MTGPRRRGGPVPALPSPNRPERAEAFGARLVAWFEREAMDRPWRRTTDPYRIWVAEVLLQQTRVEQALPYYVRFLESFPTLADLARAPQGRVLKAWEGAGYYRRARLLHAAARRVRDLHQGELPSDVEELERLPGFGPYTSRSVAALAFGRRVVALDANALRVLARVFLLRPEGPALSSPIEARGLAALGDRPPRAFNEALMELGQRFCTARAPRCPDCPVAEVCRARRELPQPGDFPPRKARGRRPRVEAAVGILLEGDRLLMGRRPEQGLLGGLWEFPGGKLEEGETPERAVVRELREETGRRTRVLRRLGVVEHDYSHFHSKLHVFLLESRGTTAPSTREGRSWRYVPWKEVGSLALPGATRKMLPWVESEMEALLPRRTPSGRRSRAPRRPRGVRSHP